MTALPAAQEAVFLYAQATDLPISIPIGDIVATASQYAVPALIAIVMWALRFLPAQTYALLMTMRVDQLLQRAIVFGVNAAAGAARDRQLTVEVGNRVLREALTFALLHGGDVVKRFAGSPVDLAEKIWARLNIAPDVSKPDFQIIAAQVSATLPARQET